MFFLLSINDHKQHYTSSLKLRCFMRRHVAHLINGGKIKPETFKTAAPKPLFLYCLLLRQLRTQLMQVKMAIVAIGVFFIV